MKRIMIAGTRSGCGKTTVTCALLQAMKNRGVKAASFKCGPDYIDPMFHKTVIGTPSYNLDGYLMTDDTINYLLGRNSADINVIEGVMGFYDGARMTLEASSYEMSKITDTNVILVVDCRGASFSAIASLTGFLNYRDTKIKGVIFNRLPEKLYAAMADECKKTGVEPLGFLPPVKGAEIKSRHLGLVTAQEIEDLRERLGLLERRARQCVNIDRILEIAECGDTKYKFAPPKKIANVKIAVASDAAFCFYYEDNMSLLRELGAEIVKFSPLKNEAVPDCDGIIFGGGYPELYADILEKNVVTIRAAAEKIKSGAPCIAECGGFMYLHEVMEDNEGIGHRMAGVIKGKCKKTNHLTRFGYLEMTAERDNILCKKGHKIRAREFHYFDSDNCGDGFTAVKGDNEWKCVHTGYNLFAGFPHIHFYTDISLAESFVKKCEEYKCMRQRI